jgi:hypothetical protein
MMQRLLMVVVLVMLGSVSSLNARPLAQNPPGLEVVVAQKAKLRDGPGVEWYILGYVDAGTTIRLDGRAPFETLWVRGITADGRIGWVFGELIMAPLDQLQALPTVWVDDPFMVSAPDPAAPDNTLAVPTPVPNDAPPAAPAPNYKLISGIGPNTRAIFRRGQQLGSRANVFSKVGDSITDSRYFLFPFGWGTYNLRDYSYLQPVVSYFSTEMARDTNNSFANPSLVAYDGLTTWGALDPNVAWPDVCQPGETPLECEYRLVKPSIALIMLGTNDVRLIPLENYRSGLERVVQISIDRGVIPVLSFIPMRAGYGESIPAFNQVIADVARAHAVPLWNFPSAIQNLEAGGLADGIHPSFPPGNGSDDYAAATDFTPENLRYGYTVRNLTALQVLDALWRQVIN